MGLKKHARHQSSDKELLRLFRKIEKIPGVKKIVLGISENCRHNHSTGTLKLNRKVLGGYKVTGYTGSGIQNITIIVDDSINEETLFKVMGLK